MDGNSINYINPLKINDLNSTFGNQYLEGAEQNYLIYGSIIRGSSGNDYLVGTEQRDQIYGYAGNDTLIGNAGNDLLEGGLDDDNLTGGSGRDTFVLYYSGGGIDTITDFTVGVDYLKVTPGPIANKSSTPIIDPLTLDSINTEAVDDFLLYDANTSVFNGIDTITDFGFGMDDRNGYKFDDTDNYIIGEQKILAPNNNSPAEPPIIIIDPTNLGLGSSFRYDANTGALFYLGNQREQQIAWLPRNLSRDQIEPTTTIGVYSDILSAPIFNDI